MKANYYKTKSNGELKDIDLKTMTMTGYFSKFGNIDSDKDMMMPGAFAKSIKERGIDGKNQIWFLADHNWNKLLSKPHVLKEDNYGLYYEAKVNKKLSYAKDVLILASEGHYSEHSFGFSYIKDKMKYIEDEDYYEVYEVKLYEGSIVALGANPDTPFLGFKSCKTNQAKSHFLIKELEKLQKGIKTKGLTDDTYFILEMQLNQIKQMINDYEPFKLTTPQEPGSHINKDDNKNYLLKLITNGI
jgi:HK97 family phage prohead protease